MPISIGDTVQCGASAVKMLVLDLVDNRAVCQIDMKILLKSFGKEKEFEGQPWGNGNAVGLFPLEDLLKIEGEN